MMLQVAQAGVMLSGPTDETGHILQKDFCQSTWAYTQIKKH
jgi:hypothetical protein